VELQLGTELSKEYLAFEAAAACRKLLETVMLVKPGENVVISADTQSDRRVVDLTAQMTFAAGAIPAVIIYPTSEGACIEPPKPVGAAIKSADVWIEYSVSYALYTEAYTEAMKNGARYICLTGMDIEMLVRTIGRVDYPKMIELGDYMCDLLRGPGEIRMTNPSGTDLIFRCTEARDVIQPGRIATKGGEPVMLGGQNGWMTQEDETINGTLVFDGACWPPNEIGIIKDPIRLEITDGRITKIGGGREASILERWLAAFNHPNMYLMAHISPGFNPGVTRCTGRIVEDERVFGCVEIGFGRAPMWDAPGHTDGITLSPTLEVDGVVIEKDGVWVEPRMRQLCKELGVAGY